MPPPFFWPTTPIPGNIFWCHFPYVETPHRPGPKARPALIRRMKRSGREIWVDVSYGTSRTYTLHDRPAEPALMICNWTEMLHTGLPRPTVFFLGRTLELPWTSDYFTCRRATNGVMEGPVIGHLGPLSKSALPYPVN